MPVVVSRVPENVKETTVFKELLHVTIEPTSGERRKFCAAEVDVVPPIALWR